MKTIGLLGGMSWESTATYYRLLNEGINTRLGGLHSAKIILNSLEFNELESAMCRGDWDLIQDRLCTGARAVAAAGADFLCICTNTMHKLADAVQEAAGIPLLHIADATAMAAEKMGVGKLGLLGTAFTMEHDFYKGRLASRGYEVLLPEAGERRDVHDIIFQELCKGVVRETSRDRYVGIVDRLGANGAQAVVLGCTEIGMLLPEGSASLPLLDTTVLHVQAALELALQ
ncbi:MAG: aspartate/glutamate racemase family protein [Desulfovibrio sp.]|uniref:aspartate/glutamate racemase family protein n=1 Tax=Desulfovibrio sp. 7SRBS1 TaxID=3378064 RepID=UPI003B3C8688